MLTCKEAFPNWNRRKYYRRQLLMAMLLLVGSTKWVPVQGKTETNDWMFILSMPVFWPRVAAERSMSRLPVAMLVCRLIVHILVLVFYIDC